MVTAKIALPNVDEVKKFVDIVSKCPAHVELVSGRYQVNGRSIMGIFSLDLSQPIQMTITGERDQQLADELPSFVVKD